MTKKITHKVTKGKKNVGGERTVRYIMILGGVILAFGLISFFFEHIFGWWFFTSLILTLLSLGGFFWGNSLYGNGEKESGASPILGGVILFLSAVFLGLDIVSINKMFGSPLPSVSYILFIATVIYFVLSYFYNNQLILILAILSFFAYIANVGGGFWAWLPFIKGGVKSHLYIAIACPFIIGVGFFHDKILYWLLSELGTKLKRFESFDRVYYFMGFLFLNSSLWMLSLFGRNPSFWPSPPKGSNEILLFTILFFFVNIATVVFGAIKRDRAFITFGAIFLTINVFTRFASVLRFEIGRSATFIIAGLILIALGLLLEKILKKK